VRRTVACLIAAATAAVLMTATARADVLDDNPAAASRGPGDLHLFARAADGTVLERHWTGGAWTEWSSLGGVATSGPAAAAYGNAINVFVRGGDGGIYQDSLSGGAWSGWRSLGGFSTSAPAAAWRRGPLNYFDLAIKGGDNAIWFETFVPGRGWSGWTSLGGNLTSAPALNSQQDGVVNVWGRGTDATLMQKYWDGSQWSGWFSLGGGIVGAPTVFSRAAGALNVYVRGRGYATYQRSWGSGGWTNWFLLDGAPIDSTPAAFSDDPSREAIVARHGANLWLKGWTASTGWGAWSDLGPVAVPLPPAPAPPPPPPPDGEVGLDTGLRCTPPDGKLRVSIAIHKAKGKAKPRVVKIVFYTKGKGRRVRVDRRRPFVVRMTINRPAGATGRVYARVYYRRSKHGRIHRKTVSRRYVVCR